MATVYRAIVLGIFHEGRPIHKIYIPVAGGNGRIIGVSNDFQPLLFFTVQPVFGAGQQQDGKLRLGLADDPEHLAVGFRQVIQGGGIMVIVIDKQSHV